MDREDSEHLVEEREDQVGEEAEVPCWDEEEACVKLNGKPILFNLRDVAVYAPSCRDSGGLMRKGLVYRSASVSRGRTTSDEVEKGSLAFWSSHLNIKTIIDLRTTTEKKSDEHDKLVEKVYPTISFTQKRAGSLGRQRFHANILSYSTLFRGFVLPASPGTKARVLRAFFAAGEDTSRLKSAKAMLCREVVSPRGLVSLYILMLTQSASMIKKILILCSDRDNHPVLFHCSSGKDRTGLIAAMIQSVCGVSREEILDSYAESEKLLSPVLQLIAEEDRRRGLSEEFDGTPRHAMEKMFEFIDDSYGDVERYLIAIGFTRQHQQKLRQALMVDVGVPKGSDSDIEPKTKEDEMDDAYMSDDNDEEAPPELGKAKEPEREEEAGGSSIARFLSPARRKRLKDPQPRRRLSSSKSSTM